MKLADLKTPTAIVDLDVLERNTQRMSERIASLDARLRPHVKTHKCVEAARLQVAGHFGGITVSTLAEARGFADGGFSDITYAVPIAPDRADQAAELATRLDHLTLLVDSEPAASALEAAAARATTQLEVLLKVDCGYHRAGVDPSQHASREFAARLARSAHLEFRGILAHAGHAYGCRSRAELRAVAIEERTVTAAFADRLRDDGLEVPVVSIGSTPTATVYDDLDGITEVRPGNYAYFDLVQARLGSCTVDDIAFSVLSSVIGRYEHGSPRLVIDAGALALSKDPGATHLDPDAGFGLARPLETADGCALRVTSLSQEHGLTASTDGSPLPSYVVGSKLRVLPNHSCLAAAAHDRVYVIRGEEVVDEWRTLRGW